MNEGSGAEIVTGEKSPVFRIEEKSTTARVWDWAAGQPFNNVLLLVILGCIVWGGKFAMTIAIPSHLKQIQTGYETLIEANRKERDSLSEDHREERQRIMQMYDKWMNRTNAEKTSESKVATQPVQVSQ